MNRMRKERKRVESLPSSPRESAGEGGDSPLFSRWTGIFGGSGVAISILGFYLLSQGSIAMAPVLLALAFLVIFPIALVK